MPPLQLLLTLTRWTSLTITSWKYTSVLLRAQQRLAIIALGPSPRRETNQLDLLLHSACAWPTQLTVATTCFARHHHLLQAMLRRKVAAAARPRTCRLWARPLAHQLVESKQW